jgi:hypothetical protein
VAAADDAAALAAAADGALERQRRQRERQHRERARRCQQRGRRQRTRRPYASGAVGRRRVRACRVNPALAGAPRERSPRAGAPDRRGVEPRGRRAAARGRYCWRRVGAGGRGGATAPGPFCTPTARRRDRAAPWCPATSRCDHYTLLVVGRATNRVLASAPLGTAAPVTGEPRARALLRGPALVRQALAFPPFDNAGLAVHTLHAHALDAGRHPSAVAAAAGLLSLASASFQLRPFYITRHPAPTVSLCY